VLQARLATALAERDAAIVERDRALSQNERLRHLLHQLQRAQFAGARRSSTRISSIWRSRISSKPLRRPKPTTTRRTRRECASAPRSAAPIAARFPVICRACCPKYACRACEEAVVQAGAPERLIKGGLPTEVMVASVLEYAWHLPLYRQAQMLAAQGLDIKRSVLAFWVGYAAAELKPVYLRLCELHPDLGQNCGR
jgi:transposase